MRRLSACCAFVLGMLSFAPACATVMASASVSNMTFTLTDLDPNDGVTPGLQFSGAGQWFSPFKHRYVAMNGSVVVINSLILPDARANLAGVPDWGAWGGTTPAGSWANGMEYAGVFLPSSQSAAFTASTLARLSSSFTLTPMTLLTLSATTLVEAAVDGGSAGDTASAVVALTLHADDGVNDMPKTVVDSQSVSVVADLYGNAEFSDDGPLSLSFANNTRLVNNISLLLHTHSAGASQMAAAPAGTQPGTAQPVGEPGSLALIGIALAAAIFRRSGAKGGRKARRAPVPGGLFVGVGHRK